jgi:hypothetical protein
MPQETEDTFAPAADWVETADRALQARFSNSAELKSHTRPLAERLSMLLLERLPAKVARELTALLPQKTHDAHPELAKMLQRSAHETADASIGFATFIETAGQILGSRGVEETEPSQPDQAEAWGRAPREAAEVFLWTVLQGIPGELKTRISENLPLELRSRMDLYSAGSDEARVA